MQNSDTPSAPKAKRIPSPDETIIDREVDELFNRSARESDPVRDGFEDFIASTARSKIAVIVPMYGYWADVPDNILDKDMCAAAFSKLRSINHNWYTFVIAEPQRMSRDVYMALNGPYVSGNLKGIYVEPDSTYVEYVIAGMEAALETNTQYIVIFNPWGILQKNSIDYLIERITMNGQSPIVCGYDMHAELSQSDFDAYKTRVPREWASYKAKHMLSFDFVGMKRMVAEMCKIDPRFETQAYAERDFFQQVAMNGFDPVVSDRVPTFFMQVPRPYVTQEMYEHDLTEFKNKWQFIPADVRIK